MNVWTLTLPYGLMTAIGERFADVRGVRSSYEWVDASGRLWDRWGFELEWEYEQNERGADDVGSMMRWYQPDVFAMGVDALIEERLDSGDLFPLYYAD